MRKYLIILLLLLLLSSCQRSIIGDEIKEDVQYDFTEYTWMVDSAENIDRYSLIVQDNGNTVLYIAHFDGMMSKLKAESVEEKHNVKVQKIERRQDKVVSITLDFIKYVAND